MRVTNKILKSFFLAGLVLYLLSPTQSKAQPFPGGVSTSIELWLKADSGISGATPITQWRDQSGNGFDASVPANGPDLINGQLNFNPILDFNSSNNEYLEITNGIIGANTYNDLWIFGVWQTDEDQTNTLIHENLSSSERLSVLAPWSNENIYLDWGSSSTGRINGVWSTNYGIYNMFTLGTSTTTATPNGTRKTISLNGNVIVSNDNNDNGTGNNSNFYIGGGYSAGNPLTSQFDGKIAELIIYTGVPTILNQERIHSYLALKYGFDKASANNPFTPVQDERDYFASDATPIWDYSSNSRYSNYVTGIGRDDNSGLNQQKSRNNAPDGAVSMEASSAFGSNLDFLLWGNDGATSLNNSDVPGGYTDRSHRIWKTQLNGTPGTVIFSIDLNTAGLPNTGSAADYAILIDSDTVFNTGATIHTTGASLVGDSLSFTGVSFSSGDFFSIGINNASFLAPGDVREGLQLWLKADSGITGSAPITAWRDQSLNNHDASAPGNGPQLLTGELNFNPVLDFNSTNSEYLEIANGIIGTATYNDIWVYGVWATDEDQTNTLFHENLNGGEWLTLLGPWSNENIYLDWGGSSGRINGNWSSNYGIYNMFTLGTSTTTNTPSGTRKTISLNGSQIITNNTNKTGTGSNSNFYIGGGYSSGNPISSQFDGKLAELVIYTDRPSALEQEKIHSYLSLKYGFDKASDDNLSTVGSDERDYFSSDETVIWDYSLNSRYSNYVTGIGRDDNSDLNQTKSRNNAPDGSVAMEAGGAFGSNLDFLLWGNDGAASLNNSDVPVGYSDRSNRIWKTQISGSPGSITFSIDLNAAGLPNTGSSADYALLIDSDTIFSTGATAHTTGASLVGDSLSFTGVNFSTGDFFAIGIANATFLAPGDVTEGLQLWLKADSGITGSAPVTEWRDQSLNNHDASAPGNGPTLLSNEINYKPALDFNSTNSEYLQITNGIMGTATYNDLWVYGVWAADEDQTNTLIHENLNGGEWFTILGPWSNENIYMDWGSSATGRINGNWSTSYGNYNMFTLGTSTNTSTPIGTRKSILLNGSLIVSNNNNDNGTGSNSNFYIGGGYSSGNPLASMFDGKIAELVVYTDRPTALEQERIHSYLALKYGFDKATEDNSGTGGTDERDYFASDETVIWDYSLNSRYSNYVTGIGRDDNSDLNLLLSKNNAPDGAVAMLAGGAFGSNLDFLLWGNDGATSLNSSDVPVGYTDRSHRIWKTQVTGTPGTVTFSIDLNAAGLPNTGSVGDYALLIDTDTIFASGATIYTTGASLVGDSLSFTGVNFSSGDFFAIGIANATFLAPGDVSEGLQLWLKADSGISGSTPITEWRDQSLNNHDAIATGNGPDLLPGQLNNYPVIDFNSSNVEYLEIVNGIIGTATYNDVWIYGIWAADVDQTNTLLHENLNGNEWLTVLGPWSNENIYMDWGASASGRINGAWNASYGIYNMFTLGTSTSTSTPNGTRKAISLNGSVLVSNNNNDNGTGSNSSFIIGGGYSAGNPLSSNFDGKIAELAVYTQRPSAIEQERVHSYLALKYGFSKASDDNTGTVGTDERDYFASDETVLWDYSLNSRYSNYVAGVGRDDNSDLNQTVSRNNAPDGAVTMATTAPFGNNLDFLLWGNDGATSINGMDVPVGYSDRSHRIWKTQLNGTPGTVTFSIDLNAAGLPNTGNVADYALLIDTDTVFASGATIHTTGASLVGDSLSFTAVNFSTGDFFAIGIANATFLAPGDVTEGLHLWLKADSGISGSAPISAWRDQSLNNHDASVPANGPTLLNTQLNYHPVVDFNSSNSEYVEIVNGIIGTATYNNVWIYGVWASDIDQTNTFLYENLNSGEWLAILGPWSNENIYMDWGGSSGRINGAWNSSYGNYNMFTLGTSTSTSTPNGTRKVISLNGSVIVSNDNNRNGTGSNSSFYIGGGYNSGNPLASRFDGKLAELVIYTDLPSSIQQEKVHSYLALKYGFDKASADNTSTVGTDERDYFASDETVIWDYTLNSIYSNYVTGIGRDDNSDFNQTLSKNNAPDGAVAMLASAPFGSDLDFLLWGNDGGTSLNSSDVPVGYTDRSHRIWKTQTNGTPGSVVFSINLNEAGLVNTGSVADYALLIDTDTIFASGATIYTTGASLVGDSLSFTGVNFATGAFFSIGINNADVQAPGDVTQGLQLWLRADSGVSGSAPITAWRDQSLNNHDATVPGNGPDLLSGQINFNPSLDFTSANSEYLQINNGIIGTATYNNLWIYGVWATDVDQTNTLLHENMNGGEWMTILAPWSNENLYLDWGSSGSGGRINSNWGANYGEYNLFTLSTSTVTSTPSGTRKSLWRNGSLFGTNNNLDNATGSNSDMIIAAGYSNGNPASSRFDGKIAELAIYTDQPSILDQEKVHSYFAIKYGISKESSDNGSTPGTDERDYFASDETVVWDFSDNTGYNSDIIGIMRDDQSALLQKQTISLDDSLTIFISTLAADNQSNAGTITNDVSGILVGHNGSRLIGNPTFSKPAGIYSRFERVWKLTNTAFADSYSFVFLWDSTDAFDINDIRLLVDTDDNFADATTLGPGDGLGFANGANGAIIISGINSTHIAANSIAYITVASNSSATSLPVEFLTFNGRLQNDKVLLNWTVFSSEPNLQAKYKVYRSHDGVRWSQLANFDQDPDLTGIISYEWIDESPLSGISYYRIKKEESGVPETFSGIVSINNSSNTSSYSIHPNPADSEIIIEGPGIGLMELKIMDSRGMRLPFRGRKEILDDEKIRVEIDELSNGLYWISLNGQTLKFIKN